MRRIFALLSTLFLGLIVLAMVSAQEPTPPADQTPEPQPIPEEVYQPAYLIEEVEPLFDLSNSGSGGGNTCQLAAEMSFPTFGGQTTNVQDFGQESSDPVLSCMWGNPSRANGYRTVWYKLSATYDAIVTLDTITSNYDTVIGVFRQTDDVNICSTLAPVACNDDYIGFSSRTSFSVAGGETYYIVVADWSSGYSGAMTLNLVLEEQPIDSHWVQVDNESAAKRTHHDTVAGGGYIYVLGGQESELESSPKFNELSRYHPASNTWTELNEMPGNGFTYLTSVFHDNKIYVPGGDDGSINGTHYLYNVASNSWTAVDSPLVPVIWSQAVLAPNNNEYYLIGGASSKPVITSSVQVHNEVWRYNFNTGNWANFTPMNTPRAGHTAVRLGDRVCVVGGLNGLELLNSGECLREFIGWEAIDGLNVARYGAGSVVGPDGKWYVFGGLTVNAADVFEPVSEVEVYDPNRPELGWSVLGIPYNLVERIDPYPPFARVWPRGERLGDHIYAIGGSHFAPALASPTNFAAIEVVQRLFVPKSQLFAPAMFASGVDVFDDNLEAARALPLDFWFNGDFQESTDFYDFFRFHLNVATPVSIQLNSIPSSSDYNLYLFNNNKLLWSSSENGGSQAERIDLILGSGTFYVLVLREYGSPESSNYWLAVLR